MSLLEGLFSPDVIGPAILHVGLLSILILASLWLEPRLRDVPLTHWLVQRLGYPLGRAAVVVAFVLAAYPALFGLETALTLDALVGVEAGRIQSLVNWVFVVSLMLPLLPWVGSFQAMVLPIQGMVATALLFHWLVDGLPRTATSQGLGYWPGWGTAMLIIALAWASHALARRMARTLGAALDARLDLEGSEDLVFETVVLLFQMPVILAYGLALGRQLSV